jgi:hypothetical protein
MMMMMMIIIIIICLIKLCFDYLKNVNYLLHESLACSQRVYMSNKALLLHYRYYC